MAYGYRPVSNTELRDIVDRLAHSPTQSSKSWRHDYNAQEENLRFLKRHDPAVHRQRSASPTKLRKIVTRLTKPTVASVTARWNYDCEDGNLMVLKMFDPNIKLPYRTLNRREEERYQPHTKGAAISVDNLTLFLDRSRPHSRANTMSRMGSQASSVNG